MARPLSELLKRWAGEQNKRLFWLFACFALFLIGTPSYLLVDSLGHYRRFLDSYEEIPLRPSRTRSTPHGRLPKAEPPRLEFVEFSLAAPLARSVGLIGDFNEWRKDIAFNLNRNPDGTWEILLPLPKGRYRYLYLVDGKETPDPRQSAIENDKTVSIKNVP